MTMRRVYIRNRAGAWWLQEDLDSHLLRSFNRLLSGTCLIDCRCDGLACASITAIPFNA